MSTRFHSTLVWLLGIASLALLVLLAYSRFQLAELRGEIRYANDIIGRFERDRDAAYNGTVTEAADALWQLHFPSFDWQGAPEPFHRSVARLVERQRCAAVRDVIASLRARTAEDLGHDPEVWIRKYGSDQSRDGLTAMQETGSNHVGAANGSQPIRSETNSTSSAAGSRR